jgi:exopolysaccharide biosynthesis polyprenyl glycosylphosphotransferase
VALVRGLEAATDGRHPTRLVGGDGGSRVHDVGAVTDRSRAQRRFFVFGFWLAATDILCMCAALLSAQLLTAGQTDVGDLLPLEMILGAGIWVLAFHAFGLYAPQHLGAPEQFRRVISASSVGTLLLLVLILGSEQNLSRPRMALTWLFAILFELGARRAGSWFLWRLRSNGRLSYRTLIIGTNLEAARLSKALEDRSSGFSPIGHIVVDSQPTDGLRVVGRMETLPQTIRELGAECLFVDPTSVNSDSMAYVRSVARRSSVDIRVSLNLSDTLSSRLSLHPVGDVVAISLRPAQLNRAQAAIKRSLDLVIGSVALLVASPLIAVIAVAVGLSSPGPVFFKQDRITIGGRPFRMFKFRTMVRDTDRIIESDKLDRTQAFFKLRENLTITRVGRLLRRFSLDELPQLWNVVKGDMSLVGPRPLPAEQVAANLALLEPRHEVRAGLTGWWQIKGRSDLEPTAAVRMDLFYIENWSISLDLYILLKTVGTVLLHKGAY